MEKKYCQSCGRIIEYRKKWKNHFSEIRYCSKRCQKLKKPTKAMQEIFPLIKDYNAISDKALMLKLPQYDREKIRSALRLLALEKKIKIKSKESKEHGYKGDILVSLP